MSKRILNRLGAVLALTPEKLQSYWPGGAPAHSLERRKAEKPVSQTWIKLFKTKTGWRWRMTDEANGKVIGASTQGYSRRIDAVRNLNRVARVGSCGLPPPGNRCYQSDLKTTAKGEVEMLVPCWRWQGRP
jgi:hypothetical protein